MGELIFSICYGGALIVFGFFTNAFVKKMEKEALQDSPGDRSIESQHHRKGEIL